MSTIFEMCKNPCPVIDIPRAAQIRTRPCYFGGIDQANPTKARSYIENKANIN